MKFGLDAYDRQARLGVTYLVFSPIVVLIVALSLGTQEWWSRVAGVLAACGAPYLAAQWGRTAGRRKEPQLWALWGGSPTTRLLRFASGEATATVEHRHENVTRATGIHLPTATEETANPAQADAVYDNAITTLKEQTRDKATFPLVFGENINYGFRRNLWGRKPIGLSVSIVTGLIAAAVLVASYFNDDHQFAIASAVAFGYAVLACLVWWLTVTPDWVKESADAYARRLIESTVRVPPASG
jgi:hypothetical protein